MKSLPIFLPALLLTTSCAHEPTGAGAPASPAETPARIVAAGATRLCGEAPRPCADAPTPTATVAELLSRRSTAGSVVVVGYVAEGERRCTQSVPPSCASSLFVEERQGRQGQKPRVSRIVLGGGHGCSDPPGKPGCCSLPVGARVRIEAAHQLETGRWGARHQLAVTAVCALP